MNVILCSNQFGYEMKEYIKQSLNQTNHNIIDLTNLEKNYIEVLKEFKKKIDESDENFGIAIDDYGNLSFMVLTKLKGMIVAQVSDERTSYMTRGHNNARAITLGSKLIANDLALSIVDNFLKAKYDGGRHQIRVDMLNKMVKEGNACESCCGL
ncbi:galactose-6-phosphate isomerase subunit LacA [Streptobacillus felis]|uniref:galactose-6-phosphate isomerase subunit LacA n=1 Tax=Streptobacillus felis TaxID=1384509 RepID=UPI00082A69A0|nr:galactose-6-phosphate isomerase subunit LacA [Streptobacillus felis]